MNLKDKIFKSELIYIKIDSLISDKTYWDYIKNKGDGYYYNKSLHFYGLSHDFLFHDLNFRNSLIKNNYSNIFGNEQVISFGEDLFGNQFVFYSKGVGILFIESGEIEYIGANFKQAFEKILEDLDYYTGQSLLIKWEKNNKSIDYNERLSPKVPFILGGEYSVENLSKFDFQKIINFNSSLANQIFELPDGSNINIKFIDNVI